jgi:surfactin synthase thioesterase subunit
VIIAHTLPPHRWGENLRLSRDQLETIFAPEYDKFSVDKLSRQDFLSAVQADFQIAASYLPGTTRLQCPAHLFTGADDTLAPPDAVAEWDRYCRVSTVHRGAGGHFDFIDHPENRALLTSTLARFLAVADTASRRHSEDPQEAS